MKESMHLPTRTLLLVCCAAAASGQTPPGDTTQPVDPPPLEKRAFGVMPNFRLADANQPFTPITPKRKMYIAFKDSTDFPVYPTAAVFAAVYQWQDQNPSFGQGMKGYAHRFVLAYGDQVIGNFLIEGILPIAFHEDPRYFRRGTGSKKSRAWYAATRIFVNKTDKGVNRFNFSEFVGNAAMAGIGNAYYPDSRRLSDNLRRFYVALGTDAFGMLAKEFSPDIMRLFHKKK
jgi:hypothetical protein